MILAGIAIKELAAEMGINYRVLRNKLNHCKVNGRIIKLTDEQRKYLANRFEIPVEEIE